MAQHLSADHSRGDANTIGGYAAVHARPAAFEGSDGYSYSVEIVTDSVADGDAAWGAYLLFVQWARVGGTSPLGHLETEYLAWGDTEEEARGVVATLALGEVKQLLDARIAARQGTTPTRRWWDVMRDEREGEREQH